MDPAELERFRKVEEVFYAAMEQPAGEERDTLVHDLCGADQNLRTEVTLLLADHERIRAAAPEPAQRLPQFGAWQAVKLLGRGGMGTVYLAERADGAFSMTAAVKVVPLALASAEIEERFRRERQFLASLDHPRIARLIDGGVSETGLPFLVMEYVQGATIDRFCEMHRLDARASAALVRQVLEALAYVHSRQVAHRDIKPSNILVDDSGKVKLLDFGTARLVDATAEAALTKTGVFAFTPEYASPEQVRGEPATFASDLYSAGVLLYRLATGHLPSQANPPPEASRRMDAALGAIVVKALSRNAAGRYRSAAEMDADLERYLQSGRDAEPQATDSVSLGHGAKGYPTDIVMEARRDEVAARGRVRRMRRWGWLLAAAVPVCFGLLWLVTSARWGHPNRKASELFALGEYHWNRHTRDSLLKAVDAFRQAAAEDPTYAAAYAYLADSYAILPEYEQPFDATIAGNGRRAARRALELDPKLSMPHGAIAWITFANDWNWAAAEPEFRLAIALAPNQPLPHQRYGLALITRSRFQEAEAELRRAHELDPVSVIAMINLAELWYYMRRFDREEEELKRVLEFDPNCVLAYVMLTKMKTVSGHPAEAVALSRKLRSLPEGLTWCQLLAEAYARGGQRDAALREAASCPGWPEVPAMYMYLGDYQRAMDLLESRYRNRSPYLQYLNVDSNYDLLKGQPRFQALLKKLGF
jgi:Tfp pilus assembly protein PilF